MNEKIKGFMEEQQNIGKLAGRLEREAEIIDKMIELADKKHRWGKLWNYLKQIKEKEQ